MFLPFYGGCYYGLEDFGNDNSEETNNININMKKIETNNMNINVKKIIINNDLIQLKNICDNCGAIINLKINSICNFCGTDYDL